MNHPDLDPGILHESDTGMLRIIRRGRTVMPGLTVYLEHFRVHHLPQFEQPIAGGWEENNKAVIWHAARNGYPYLEELHRSLHI